MYLGKQAPTFWKNPLNFILYHENAVPPKRQYLRTLASHPVRQLRQPETRYSAAISTAG
jgi:hypothetical protein